MKKLTGFAVINCEVGKKIAYTYTEINENGNIIKSNVKESFVAIDDAVLKAIEVIETGVTSRLTAQ